MAVPGGPRRAGHPARLIGPPLVGVGLLVAAAYVITGVTSDGNGKRAASYSLSSRKITFSENSERPRKHKKRLETVVRSVPSPKHK